MKLSNTFLLQAVWAIAITGLMLLSAAIARADVMTADVVLDPLGSDHGPFGVIEI